MIFYKDAAEKVRKFIETHCIQSKYPWTGKPVKLMDWQLDQIINPIYGNLDSAGNRIIKKAGIWIPKKQGKTTLLAALALYHLLEQPGAECYCIASDIQQANILFSQAADFVELNPKLATRLWVRRNLKVIEDKKHKSVFKVLSSEPTGKAGFNANFIAYDELAEWPSAHARDIWDQLAYASAARHNALQVVISTAQFDRQHIGYEQYLLAKKIKQDPEIDPSFHPVIYEVPEHADWQDENNWWDALPSAGVTVPKQFYHDEFAKTQTSPLEESRFRTLLLNQWVGSAEQWVASNIWSLCGEDFSESEFHGSKVWAGIDYARRADLCSYVLIAERDSILYLMPRFFIPRELALQKQKTDNVPYLAWANGNYNLYLTDGDTVDPGFMRAKLLAEPFSFHSIGFDPYGMEETRQILEFQHHLPMIEVPQSPTHMAGPTSHFEKLVLSKGLRHPNNPILTWNLGNCVVRDSGGAIMLDKKRATNRIDGITASIIALSRYMARNQQRVFMASTAIYI